MIYSVHGKLVHLEPNLAVVECGGVGAGVRTWGRKSPCTPTFM